MKYTYLGENGKVAEKEMPDDEWNRMKKERKEAVDLLNWEYAKATFPDGSEGIIQYKIYSSQVYLEQKSLPSNLTWNDLEDLKIQIRRFDYNKKSDAEENHVFMSILKGICWRAYDAVRKGRAANIIEFKNDKFNFKCDKGCVGQIFKEAGYTEYKQIARYILIDGEKTTENKLKNSSKNSPPKMWEVIKPIFFPSNSEITPK